MNLIRKISVLLFLTCFISGSAFTQKNPSEENFVSLPSPLQIVLIFQNPDMIFDSIILSSAENASTYSTEYAKLLNFGVYTADMAFCVQNQEFKYVKKYLASLKTVTENSEANSIFDELGLLERFENCKGNKDSVISILLDLSMNLEVYLEDNELMHIASIQFAGAWIEGMYIASHIAVKKNTKSISKVIVQQSTVLSNIVTVMNSMDDEDPKHLLLTQKLRDLNDELDAMKTIKTFKKKDEILPLTKEELLHFNSQIIDIRNLVVKQ